MKFRVQTIDSNLCHCTVNDHVLEVDCNFHSTADAIVTLPCFGRQNPVCGNGRNYIQVKTVFNKV